MVTRSDPTHFANGLSAATRRFPSSEFAIRKLMADSEAFRDMCEELAEAEQALANVQANPPEVRPARQQEWQQLVDRLVEEVSTALTESQRRWNRTGSL